MRAGFRQAAIVSGLALALTTGARAPAPTQLRVDIKEFTYAPGLVTVRSGTTVTWVNHDEEPHTVTAAAGGFGSAGLSHDETFAQTFTRPGTYRYFCALHPKMQATVIVR